MVCCISLIFHGDVSLIRAEVLKMDQKMNVVVLDFDDEKKRISLGLKQLTPHPWDVLPENIAEGNIVKGKVVNIEDYGAFLEIMPGVEGLVHVSEITWANTPINAKEFFKLGDEHEAKIVTLDKGKPQDELVYQTTFCMIHGMISKLNFLKAAVIQAW